MKSSIIHLTIAAMVLLGTVPQAGARSHQSARIYISGYTSCGVPIYVERYFIGYDPCGNEIWGKRVSCSLSAAALPCALRCRFHHPGPLRALISIWRKS